MQSCLDSDDKGFYMFFSDNFLKYVFLGAKPLRYIIRKNGLNSLKAIITSPPTSHLVKLSLPNIFCYSIQCIQCAQHKYTSNACQHCVPLLPSCLSGFSGSGHDLDSCILIH